MTDKFVKYGKGWAHPNLKVITPNTFKLLTLFEKRKQKLFPKRLLIEI